MSDDESDSIARALASVRRANRHGVAVPKVARDYVEHCRLMREAKGTSESRTPALQRKGSSSKCKCTAI